MDFYQGKILRVDLSAMTTSVEPLRMDWAELYVGGKGLLFRYLLGEVAPGLDPFSPDDPLMFFTGPFAGTGVSTYSRLVVGCKSPQTGTILGGDLPPDTLAGKAAVKSRFVSPRTPSLRPWSQRCAGMRHQGGRRLSAASHRPRPVLCTFASPAAGVCKSIMGHSRSTPPGAETPRRSRYGEGASSAPR